MKRTLFTLIALGLALTSSPVALAQTTPSPRTITLIVPFAPGGPTDVIARLVAEPMARELGVSIVVENIAGAGGTVGALRAAQAKPDGMTMVLGNLGTHAANVGLFPELPYDPRNDFQPVGLIASTPIVVAVKKDLANPDPRAVIARLRMLGSAASYGHSGGTSQLACVFFGFVADLKGVGVTYRGTAPAMNDLVGGRLDYLCDQIVNVAPQARAGTVHAVLTATQSRAEALPDVPTSAEAGVERYEVTGWNALFLPKAVPSDLVGRYVMALDKALDDPQLKARLADLGAERAMGAARGPAPLSDLVSSEIEKWVPVIRAAGIKG
jgi:tripartite-type tricarboxylate transporter receptor subunit TctC